MNLEDLSTYLLSLHPAKIHTHENRWVPRWCRLESWEPCCPDAGYSLLAIKEQYYRIYHSRRGAFIGGGHSENGIRYFFDNNIAGRFQGGKRRWVLRNGKVGCGNLGGTRSFCVSNMMNQDKPHLIDLWSQSKEWSGARNTSLCPKTPNVVALPAD